MCNSEHTPSLWYCILQYLRCTIGNTGLIDVHMQVETLYPLQRREPLPTMFSHSFFRERCSRRMARDSEPISRRSLPWYDVCNTLNLLLFILSVCVCAVCHGPEKEKVLLLKNLQQEKVALVANS